MITAGRLNIAERGLRAFFSTGSCYGRQVQQQAQKTVTKRTPTPAELDCLHKMGLGSWEEFLKYTNSWLA